MLEPSYRSAHNIFSVFFFPPEPTAPLTELASSTPMAAHCFICAQPLVRAKLQSRACADALAVNGTTPERLLDKGPSRQGTARVPFVRNA